MKKILLCAIVLCLATIANAQIKPPIGSNPRPAWQPPIGSNPRPAWQPPIGSNPRPAWQPPIGSNPRPLGQSIKTNNTHTLPHNIPKFPPHQPHYRYRHIHYFEDRIRYIPQYIPQYIPVPMPAEEDEKPDNQLWLRVRQGYIKNPITNKLEWRSPGYWKENEDSKWLYKRTKEWPLPGHWADNKREWIQEEKF
jgi:hypothetical protein